MVRAMDDLPPRPRGSRGLPLLRPFVEQAPELRPFTLWFEDPEQERRYRVDHFRDVLPFIRFAHVLGLMVWIAFGLLAQLVLDGSAARTDAILRYGIGVSIVLAGLAATYAPWYPRRWPLTLAVVLVASGVVWSTHHLVVPDAPASWAWAGLMVILAFTYVLSREPFMWATVIGAITIAYHTGVTVFVAHDPREDVWFASFFLLVFAAIGMAAAYGLERFGRLVFLRERELDAERRRSDALLRNTLPGGIVERLKEPDAPEAGSIADGHAAVTVLFADLVGFTEHAGRIPPHDLVAVLDDVFTAFDDLADRLGMEKIKTVGDAYMAVAGAPEPRPDHAEAAVEMALGILDRVDGLRWPTGEPMQVRVGIASGPVVAGVIGRRKFAYDLWGDTVNLASRLEANGEPGRVLVAESTAGLLDHGYALSDPRVIEVKGKGPTAARFLLGRAS
jgi:class 3 adenylate cyclase